MITLELTEATDSLAKYARKVAKEPVILTEGGKPVAALVSIENADWETIALSSNRRFIALIERSRERQRGEGGISSAEMRRRLKPKTARRKERTFAK